MSHHHATRASAAAILALVLTATSACAESSSPTAIRPAAPSASATTAPSESVVRDDLAFEQLESEYNARLGVYAIDTGSMKSVGYRDDERFPYASTYKALAAGIVLQRSSDAEIDSIVHYTASDLVSYSPITQEHVDTGMTLRDLCDAAVRYSDNTAGNLLFNAVGGPTGLNKALKKLGDDTTHMDRLETELNEAVPGDIRDTSTPRALATDLRTLALGTGLPAAKRAVLTDWMKRNTTGDALIRAAAESSWSVGDKSGTGEYGTRNDIAILWPPHGHPIVISVLSTRPTMDATPDDALVAQAAKTALSALANNSG